MLKFLKRMLHTPALSGPNQVAPPVRPSPASTPVVVTATPASPIPGKIAVSRQSSSLDEILSSSPNCELLYFHAFMMLYTVASYMEYSDFFLSQTLFIRKYKYCIRYPNLPSETCLYVKMKQDDLINRLYFYGCFTSLPVI